MQVSGRLCARLGIPFHLERVAVRREPPWKVSRRGPPRRYGASRGCTQGGRERVATAHTADTRPRRTHEFLEGSGPAGRGHRPGAGSHRPLLGARRAISKPRCARRSRGRGREQRARASCATHPPRVLPFWDEAVDPPVSAWRASISRGRDMVEPRACRPRELPRSAAHRREVGVEVAIWHGCREAAAETGRQAARDLGHSGALRGHAQKALRGLLVPGARRGALRSGGVIVERSGRWLRVGQGRLPALAAHDFPVPGELALPEVGLVLDARCFERAPGYAAPREAGCAAFDADLLPHRLHVRGRRRGDRFAPFGGPAERRLKSFLIDAGVPRWERDRVPLVEAGHDIIWVAGLRRGQAAPVGRGRAYPGDTSVYSGRMS